MNLNPQRAHTITKNIRIRTDFDVSDRLHFKNFNSLIGVIDHFSVCSIRFS